MNHYKKKEDATNLLKNYASERSEDRVKDLREVIKEHKENSQVLPLMIKTFEEGFDHEDFVVRRRSAWLLGKLKNEKGIDVLVNKGLKDPVWNVRKVSALALDEMGPVAKQAVSPLIKLLEPSNEEYYVRKAAMKALVSIGDTEKAIPALIDVGKTTKDEDLKNAATEAIKELKKNKKNWQARLISEQKLEEGLNL